MNHKKIIPHCGRPSKPSHLSSMLRKGCTPETLRSWHQKHLAKQNPVTISTESQAARIAELERENRELKQANEIIRKAAGIEAQAELGRPHK
ncbi:hypothetical protein ENHAE0001_1423 [Enhydrobacter aerosaccus SK60]|nr:hypothetical protein ENHAE0001_1423 [Enhydrobacter aerosaccus SK60]